MKKCEQDSTVREKYNTPDVKSKRVDEKSECPQDQGANQIQKVHFTSEVSNSLYLGMPLALKYKIEICHL